MQTQTPQDTLIQRNRSVRILAKSIFRELQAQGYDDKQIVSLATELLSEVTQHVGRVSGGKAAAPRVRRASAVD